jgi:hypothetical protein
MSSSRDQGYGQGSSEFTTERVTPPRRDNLLVVRGEVGFAAARKGSALYRGTDAAATARLCRSSPRSTRRSAWICSSRSSGRTPRRCAPTTSLRPSRDPAVAHAAAGGGHRSRSDRPACSTFRKLSTQSIASRREQKSSAGLTEEEAGPATELAPSAVSGFGRGSGYRTSTNTLRLPVRDRGLAAQNAKRATSPSPPKRRATASV